MANTNKVLSALVGVGLTILGSATAGNGMSTANLQKEAANYSRVSTANDQRESQSLGRADSQQTSSSGPGKPN